MICGVIGSGNVEQQSKRRAVIGEAALDKTCSAAIDTIKNWMRDGGQTHVRNDDAFILQYLTISGFDVEVTKERIARYLDIRRANPKWFQRPDENAAKQIICEQMVYYTTNFIEDSELSVCVLRMGVANFDKHSVEEYHNIGIYAAESAFDDIRFQVFGAEVVLDFAHISIRSAKFLSGSSLWKMINLWQGAMPVKVKRFHILNAPTMLNQFMFLATCLLNKSSKNKILNHKSDLKSLHAAISPKYLPFEYGGTAGSAETFANESMALFKRKMASLDDKKINH